MHSITRFSCFAIILVFSFYSNAQQADSNDANQQNTPETSQPIQPRFSVNLPLLEKENSANESFWLDIDEHKTLVLKHWARGKVLRGDLILLHAQSENADHSRLIQPLAKHFSRRGWHVYIPNLPQEDYPEIKKVEVEISADIASNDQASDQSNNNNSTQSNPNSANNNSQSTQNTPESSEPSLKKPDNFFETEKTYQAFINQLLNNLTASIQPKSENLLVITNQNSAFWVLESSKTNSAFSQLALLNPQIPHNFDNNLETSFNGQTLPVFAFFEDIENQSDFINAFDRQLWRSPFQRINRGSFSNRGIEEENPQIAKLIIGWVTRIQKQK